MRDRENGGRGGLCPLVGRGEVPVDAGGDTECATFTFYHKQNLPHSEFYHN